MSRTRNSPSQPTFTPLGTDWSPILRGFHSSPENTPLHLAHWLGARTGMKNTIAISHLIWTMIDSPGTSRESKRTSTNYLWSSPPQPPMTLLFVIRPFTKPMQLSLPSRLICPVCLRKLGLLRNPAEQHNWCLLCEIQMALKFLNFTSNYSERCLMTILPVLSTPPSKPSTSSKEQSPAS